MPDMDAFKGKLKNLYPNKGRVVGAVISVVSISLAHYAGFLSKVPLQIVAASGANLILGVTATFIFYISFSAILARVIVWFFLPFLLLLFVATGRAEHGFKLKGMSKKKKFVKNYNGMIENENLIVLLAQLGMFALIMPGLYLDPKFSWSSATLFVVVLFLVVLSGLFRAKFLLLFNIDSYMKRLKKRSDEKINAVSAALFTAITALVVSSYAMGLMRVNMLTMSEPQQITNRYFIGYANLLASSGSSALVYEKADGKARYMYLTADYALAVESEPKSFPLLGSESRSPNKAN